MRRLTLGVLVFVATFGSRLAFSHDIERYVWTPSADGRSEYALTLKNHTWEGAKAEAEAEAVGGHLVTIASKEENELVAEVARNSDLRTHSGGIYNSAWIGLKGPLEGGATGKLQWITSEPVKYINVHKPGQTPRPYTHWYIHGVLHPDGGEWNNGHLAENEENQPHGVIERRRARPDLTSVRPGSVENRVKIVSNAEPAQVPEAILKEFGFLVGDWKTNGRSGDAKTTGTWSARWAKGKHCLIARCSFTPPGEDQPRTSAGVIGWDPIRQGITHNEFWANGECHTYHWSVKSPTEWEGKVISAGDGKESTSEARLSRKGPDEWVLERKDLDGEEIEVVFRRVKRMRKARQSK